MAGSWGGREGRGLDRFALMDAERRKKLAEYGRRGYEAMVASVGIEEARRIARENGKKPKRRPVKKKVPRAMKW